MYYCWRCDLIQKLSCNRLDVPAYEVCNYDSCELWFVENCETYVQKHYDFVFYVQKHYENDWFLDDFVKELVNSLTIVEVKVIRNYNCSVYNVDFFWSIYMFENDSYVNCCCCWRNNVQCVYHVVQVDLCWLPTVLLHDFDNDHLNNSTHIRVYSNVFNHSHHICVTEDRES